MRTSNGGQPLTTPERFPYPSRSLPERELKRLKPVPRDSISNDDAGQDGQDESGNAQTHPRTEETNPDDAIVE
jgi:hypothetical protein